MKIYILLSYDINPDSENIRFAHIDENLVVRKAIEFSKNTSLTYRLETWENDVMLGGWRFFRKGRELTEEIRKILTE